MDRSDLSPSPTLDPLVRQAQRGDAVAFEALFERHRRELRVHCYRMLGSFTDAEDLTQESFLRAWGKLGTFEGRSSFRAWLYKIATNLCLDALGSRARRHLPFDAVAPIDPDSMPVPAEGISWIEPFPDELLTSVGHEPDATVVAAETIELAFLAAIQHLPPAQRAVLLLRDVLGWPARDVAVLLEISEAAVKSSLQRARGTMRRQLPERRADWTPRTQPDPSERITLQRYMEAHERDDLDALADVLLEDVRVAYPQMGIWCDSRDSFINGSRKFAPPGQYRFVSCGANRQPAVGIYLRSPGDTDFRITALEVLRIENGYVVEIVDFDLPDQFAAFGMPATL